MAKSRVFSPTGQSPVKPKHPQTAEGWRSLIDRAIERATEGGDRRLTGLQKAKTDGKAEVHLRSMGILSEIDILREFPARTGNG